MKRFIIKRTLLAALFSAVLILSNRGVAYAQSNYLLAIDFEYPKRNIALMPSFQEETIKHLRLLQEFPDRFLFYPSASFDLVGVTYSKSGKEEGMNQVINMMMGSYIRINEHFIVPVNFDMLDQGSLFWHSVPDPWYSTPDEIYSSFPAASGLVFQSRFGLLGVFARYNLNYSDYNSVDTIYNLADIMKYYDEQRGDYYTETNVEFAEKTNFTNFKWIIVPLINSAEFPALGSVVKTIIGYFGLDEIDSINWPMRLVSQPISLGPLMFQAIELYYVSETYDLQTKNQFFGIKLNMMLDNSILLDLGYRNFLDTKYYDDTPFAPFVRLLFTLGTYNPDDWVGLTFYMDRKFLLPKIGCIWKRRKWMMFGEIGYYKDVFQFQFVFVKKFGQY